MGVVVWCKGSWCVLGWLFWLGGGGGETFFLSLPLLGFEPKTLKNVTWMFSFLLLLFALCMASDTWFSAIHCMHDFLNDLSCRVPCMKLVTNVWVWHQCRLCFGLASVVDDFYTSCTQLPRRMQDSADRVCKERRQKYEHLYVCLLSLHWNIKICVKNLCVEKRK